MRLWSIHPKYLDTKGLLAVWREALLAQKVLEGKTRGYKNHPQLKRFLSSDNPLKSIGCFLSYIYEEATKRGYNFNKEKIMFFNFCSETLKVTKGQIEFEREHLLNKLQKRDAISYNNYSKVRDFEIHPIFMKVNGPIEDWEKTN